MTLPRWPACASVVVLAVSCGGPELALRVAGTDTVAVSLRVRTGGCPSGPGWLLEGVGDVVGALVWLPADTAGGYEVSATGSPAHARVVIQWIAGDEMRPWRAAQGRIVLSRGGRAAEGTLEVRDDSIEATGSFRAPPATADSTACLARPGGTG